MAIPKFLQNNAGQITEVIAAIDVSANSASAGQIPALDAAGKLSQTFMPTGIGADTQAVIASEALVSGNLVNIWNSSGVAKARKADAAVLGKEAHGYVLDAVAVGASATVYFEGNNSSVTGLTPGKQYLSTTAGLCTATAPSASTNIVQLVGFATSATNLNFQSLPSILLA